MIRIAEGGPETGRKWLLAGLVAAIAGVSAGLSWAQAPAPIGSATAGTEAVGAWETNAAKMEFDVASVKQSKSGDGPNSNIPLGPGSVYVPNGGTFMATGMPLSVYIMFAYKMSPGSRTRPDDLSQVWRHAIEEHPQNFGSAGLKAELVRAVRDAAVQIVQGDPHLLSEVVDILELKGESWKVFRRIGLHLLRVTSDVPLDLVRTRLLDRTFFESADTRHEYVLLEKQRFGELSQTDRETIFGWIEGGPLKCEETLKAWQEYTGRPTTDEIREQFIAQWKRDRLAPLEEFLNEEWKHEYATVCERLGVPEHPEFTSYTRPASFGAHSPVTANGLSALPAVDLVNYLKSWTPVEGQIHGATPEGLGRDLRTIVGRNPEFYATSAGLFAEISEPTYIRAVLEGLREALGEGRPFDWPPVIDLCVWASRREREMPGRGSENHYMQADPDWGGVRAAIARLLNSGFTSNSNRIPFKLRGQVWQAIEPITDDPDPQTDPQFASLDEENGDVSKSGPAIASPVNLLSDAINSVRGSIMETVIRYAVWVQNEGKQGSSSPIEAKRGFGVMPEVQTILERHLDPSIDDSPVIRSVYGEHFCDLVELDRSWVEAQTSVIFPGKEPTLWRAAWDAYLGCCPPAEQVFRSLKDDYALAIQELGSETIDRGSGASPDHPLIRHLMVLYWREHLDLRGGLIQDFYNKASAVMRGRALNYVGWSLRNWNGPIPPEAAVRLKKLLEWRVENAEDDKTETAEELKEFGWWFISEKFDDAWSISQLQRVLDLTGQAVPTHLVVERLANLSASMPRESLRAVKDIIEGLADQWEIVGWIEPAKEIVLSALNSGDAVAVSEAVDLANILGSRGHFVFLEILKLSLADRP
jgi:hypothetical protein